MANAAVVLSRDLADAAQADPMQRGTALLGAAQLPVVEQWVFRHVVFHLEEGEAANLSDLGTDLARLVRRKPAAGVEGVVKLVGEHAADIRVEQVRAKGKVCLKRKVDPLQPRLRELAVEDGVDDIAAAVALAGFPVRAVEQGVEVILRFPALAGGEQAAQRHQMVLEVVQLSREGLLFLMQLAVILRHERVRHLQQLVAPALVLVIGDHDNNAEKQCKAKRKKKPAKDDYKLGRKYGIKSYRIKHKQHYTICQRA